MALVDRINGVEIFAHKKTLEDKRRDGLTFGDT